MEEKSEKEKDEQGMKAEKVVTLDRCNVVLPFS
jgi:hypothetical protein